jgi:hypothetical protein
MSRLSARDRSPLAAAMVKASMAFALARRARHIPFHISFKFLLDPSK